MLILKLSQFFILGKKKKKSPENSGLLFTLEGTLPFFVFALLASADKYPQEKAEC